MRPDENCPTCGSKLGPLHERAALRRCEACQQLNPRGFRYCGSCAAPMEKAAAPAAEIAPPPGGWPSLSRELVELRFFLDRGELDEAFELLEILHKRYPGHPALVEFNREPGANKPRPDTQVYQVVDAVLAESSSLSAASLPRRAAPQWNAPVAEDAEEGKKTRAHAAVPLGSDDDEPTSRRAGPAEARRSKAVAAAQAPRSSDAPKRARTDKHLGAVPVDAEPAVAKRSKRGTSGAVPKAARAAASRPGMTVAVPTLQPPKPFQGEPAVDDEDARPTAVMSADKALRAARSSKPAKQATAADERRGPASTGIRVKGGVRKRMLEPELAASVKAVAVSDAPSVTASPKKTVGPKKPTGKQAAVPKPAEPTPAKKRPFGARFGSGVLGRLGGKGKP
jgi:hypothetical protein